MKLDLGSIRSSLRDGLSTPYRLTKEQCQTTFDYPGCGHFDKGATCKIDDVLIEHGGLPHDLPLAVHL